MVKINKPRELVTRRKKRKGNVLFMGDSNTGKKHQEGSNDHGVKYNIYLN